MPQTSVLERVLGVTDPTNIPRALAQAHLTLTGEPLPEVPSIYLQQDITEDDIDAFRHLGTSRIDTMLCVADLLLGREIETTTTLTDWYNYQHMAEAFGTRVDRPATALMLGSLNALSSRSFDCLARDVYGADRTLIVDLEDDADKARHGTFIQASALELPFGPESIDVVHTHRLIYQLRDHVEPARSPEEQMHVLCSEIIRVLKPGGQAYLLEVVPESIDPELINKEQILELGRRFVVSLRAIFGTAIEDFNAVATKYDPDFTWLLDPNRNFSVNELLSNLKVWGTYIKKRHS